MKITFFYFLFAVSFLGFSSCNENVSSDKNKTEQEVTFDDILGREMLIKFYNEYIPLVENSLDFKEIQKLQEANCSAVFYKELKKWEIDYDPFLNAQDASSEWLNSLSIEPIKEREKTFRVTYQYDDEPSEIILTLDVIDGEYKIVGIDQ